VSDVSDAEAGLAEVRILRMSLPVFRRAAEQNDELLREFALIRVEGSDHVPARLLALIGELNARFGGFSTDPTAALEAALERDEQEVNLVYRVPVETKQAVLELSALLDEADDFCRAGDLLTLATPPESLAFRRWFLDEFLRQVDGEPPRSWPEAIGAETGG
jgi:hypothetical protein